MFILDWYKQWLDIRSRYRSDNILVERDEKVCASCETLKQQLEIANYEKQQLLNRILEKPEAPAPTVAPNITPPRMIPWNVRRQMLEREDREKARALRNAPKPDSEINAKEAEETAAFEKELNDATAKREAEAHTGGAQQSN